MKCLICSIAFLSLLNFSLKIEARDILSKLQEIVIIDQKAMMPMRDGICLASDIYRPKTDKPVPVIFSGTPYNLNSCRDGYDKEVFMEDGKVYKLEITPISTSNFFAEGHRIRIEISSSNFPGSDRNMNTGGINYDESVGVKAHHSIHHSIEFPSRIMLPVVKQQ